MTTAQLPPGYLEVGELAIHVAQLRKYSSDIHRFQKYLPLALEINALPQEVPDDAPELHSLFEQADDPMALHITMMELHHIHTDSADELMRILEQRRANQ